jgi:hypothetical protein
MIIRYNLVPWEKLTLLLEEAKQLLIYHYMHGWTLHAYLYTPRSCYKKVIGMNLWIGLNYYQWEYMS